MEGEIDGVGFSWQSVCDLNSAMAKLHPGDAERSVQAILITTGNADESQRSVYTVMRFLCVLSQDKGPVQ